MLLQLSCLCRVWILESVGGGRGRLRSFSITLHLDFGGRVSINLEAHRSGQAGNPPGSVASPSPSLGLNHAPPQSFLYMGAGNRTQVLMLVWQVFYYLSHLLIQPLHYNARPSR